MGVLSGVHCDGSRDKWGRDVTSVCLLLNLRRRDALDALMRYAMRCSAGQIGDQLV